jgi:deoxyribonuclease V
MSRIDCFQMPADHAEAVRIQRRLAERVRLEPLEGFPRLVAGADVAFLPRRSMGVAALVIVDRATMQTVEEVRLPGYVHFPYIPGLLSFREIPLLLECFARARVSPDLIICDGQGIAHPRRAGLASHLGVMLNRPTVGCAKSRLVGRHEEPGRDKGEVAVLCHGEREIGRVVRTRTGVKPVFVSPGHLITIEEAAAVVLECTGRFRLPEPVRRAHLAAEAEKRRLPGGPETSEAGEDESHLI